MAELRIDLAQFAQDHEPCIVIGVQLREVNQRLKADFGIGTAVQKAINLPQMVALLAGLRTAHDKLIEEFSKGLGVTDAEMRNSIAQFINDRRIERESEDRGKVT